MPHNVFVPGREGLSPVRGVPGDEEVSVPVCSAAHRGARSGWRSSSRLRSERSSSASQSTPSGGPVWWGDMGNTRDWPDTSITYPGINR